jgi:hypothetical protein
MWDGAVVNKDIDRPRSKETEVFDPGSVAYVMNVRYPTWRPGDVVSNEIDQVRGNQALETIKKALAAGHKVIVGVASDNSPYFAEALSDSGAIIVRRDKPDKTNGFLLGLKRATKEHGVKAIMFMQPEKNGLINSAEELSRPIRENLADVVVPKRNDRLFKETIPKYMYDMETGNNVYARRLLKKLWLEKRKPEEPIPDFDQIDYFFGTAMVSNDAEMLEKLFAVYEFTGKKGKEDVGRHIPKEATFYPIESAIVEGCRILGVEVPFRYDETIKKNEEDNPEMITKREEQRRGLLVAMANFGKMAVGHERARLKPDNP